MGETPCIFIYYVSVGTVGRYITTAELNLSGLTGTVSHPDMQKIRITGFFLISSFRRVLNVLCSLLGNSPVSEIYMPTFRNTVPSSPEGMYGE